MKVDVTFNGVKPDPELRSLCEEKARMLAERFGPLEKLSVMVRKDFIGASAKYELLIPPQWRLTGGASGSDARSAIEHLFVSLSGFVRSVTWNRDGIAHACSWCQKGRFVHVQRTIDRGEGVNVEKASLLKVGTDWRGALEALVCTSCGHVEWFVSDPESLPIGNEWGTMEITTRTVPPYR